MASKKKIENSETQIAIEPVIGTVTAPRLNVRKTADMSAEVLRVVSLNEELELDSTEKTNNFFKLKNGGFVLSDFVKVK